MLLIAALACLFEACATKKKVKAAKPARIGSTETGIASWYGDPYHGRRAANGEIYDMEKLTAAHRTLPFGTWVRVRNLTNNRTVDVRIQDRGPFVGHRIIDLSRAAAREIELLGPGTAKVKLTIISQAVVVAQSPARLPEVTTPVAAKSNAAAKQPVQPVPIAQSPAHVPDVTTGVPANGEASRPAGPIEGPPLAPIQQDAELFAVQIGAFADRGKAEALRAGMSEKYGAARIVIREGKTPLYRVLVGEEDSMEKAAALAERMRADNSDGFVVRLDTAGPVQ
jgi:rare lipoprotein A